MSKFVGLLIIVLTLSACKQQSSTTSSLNNPSLMPGSCTIGKWAGSSPQITLKMSSEFVADYTNADLVGGLNPLEQMAKVWNNAVAPSSTLIQVPFPQAATTGYSDVGSFRDSEFGIYKSHTWFSNVSSNALAITQFYGYLQSDATLGTYINLTHADIIFNYRDFGSSFKMKNAGFWDYDVPTVLLHEMGHFLGLCHESNNVSIMAPYYSSTQRTLQTFDTNKIKALYLNNQNYGVSALSAPNALTAPQGTAVKGIVELLADGKCRHYINGKMVYEHESGQKKGFVQNKAFYKALSKFKNLF